MPVGDSKCIDKIERLREDLWRIWEQLPGAGEGVPTITENEERAYRQGMRFYGLLVGEYTATASKSAPALVVNLNEVSTDELKRLVAEARKQ